MRRSRSRARRYRVPLGERDPRDYPSTPPSDQWKEQEIMLIRFREEPRVRRVRPLVDLSTPPSPVTPPSLTILTRQAQVRALLVPTNQFLTPTPVAPPPSNPLSPIDPVEDALANDPSPLPIPETSSPSHPGCVGNDPPPLQIKSKARKTPKKTPVVPRSLPQSRPIFPLTVHRHSDIRKDAPVVTYPANPVVALLVDLSTPPSPSTPHSLVFLARQARIRALLAPGKPPLAPTVLPIVPPLIDSPPGTSCNLPRPPVEVNASQGAIRKIPKPPEVPKTPMNPKDPAIPRPLPPSRPIFPMMVKYSCADIRSDVPTVTYPTTPADTPIPFDPPTPINNPAPIDPSAPIDTPNQTPVAPPAPPLPSLMSLRLNRPAELGLPTPPRAEPRRLPRCPRFAPIPPNSPLHFTGCRICDEKGHRYPDCPTKRHRCFFCGRWDVDLAYCPDCQALIEEERRRGQ